MKAAKQTNKKLVAGNEGRWKLEEKLNVLVTLCDP